MWKQKENVFLNQLGIALISAITFSDDKSVKHCDKIEFMFGTNMLRSPESINLCLGYFNTKKNKELESVISKK